MLLCSNARSSVLYFVLFVGNATWVPFSSLALQDAGFQLADVALMLAIARLVALIAAPAVSRWADKMHHRKLATPQGGCEASGSGVHVWLLAVLAALASVPMLVLDRLFRWRKEPSLGRQVAATPLASFTFISLLLALHSVASSPKMALCDTIVLSSGAVNEGSGEYARHRLWGSISWGLTALVVGAVVESSTPRGGNGSLGVSYESVPLIHALAMLALSAALFLFFRPSANVTKCTNPRVAVDTAAEAPVKPAEASPAATETKPADCAAGVSWIAQSLGGLDPDTWAFLRRHRFLRVVVLPTVTLLSVVEHTSGTLLFPYLRAKEARLLASSVTPGLPMLISGMLLVDVVSETCVFRFAGKALEGLGARSMLAVAALTYAVKAAAYATSDSHATLLAVEGLHGLSYAFMWCAAVAVVRDAAHQEGARPTASCMALLWLCCNGVPPLVATAVPGLVMHFFGENVQAMFCCTAALSTAVAAVVAFAAADA